MSEQTEVTPPPAPPETMSLMFADHLYRKVEVIVHNKRVDVMQPGRYYAIWTLTRSEQMLIELIDAHTDEQAALHNQIAMNSINVGVAMFNIVECISASGGMAVIANAMFRNYPTLAIEFQGDNGIYRSYSLN